MNYYNDNDPNSAAWLRELIAQGLLPPGEVDGRSIADVAAADLAGFRQVHFFCGIGGWPLALALAGWPADRAVWTGSCPCQPFSQAGKRGGSDDERHLWPEFMRLIGACRPPVVFGEQVASADVLGKVGRGHAAPAECVWLDGVFADLEAARYTCGACDIPAAGVGAPHIRQRVFWLAYAGCERGAGRGAAGELDGAAREIEGAQEERERLRNAADDGGSTDGLADTPGARCDRPVGGAEGEARDKARMFLSGADGTDGWLAYTDSHRRDSRRGEQRCADGPGSEHGHSLERCGGTLRLGHANDPGPQGRGIGPLGEPHTEGREEPGGFAGLPGVSGGHWSDTILIPCGDGKTRRISPEPSLFPLAPGLPYKLARRGSIRPALLKGAGNAIVPQAAAEFIKTFLEIV